MRALIALISATAVAAVLAVPALGSSGVKKVRVGPSTKFSVKTLTIARGTKVTWNWTGGLPHNVTVKSGPASFHSKTQSRGSYSHIFTRKGTYTLICTIHVSLGMKMTIKVT